MFRKTTRSLLQLSLSLALALALLLATLPPGAAQAASFLVADYGQLQAAISAANGNSEADTITLAADILITTQLDITSEITILGNGYALDGGGSSSIFYVLSGATLRIENTTLRNGRAGYGGGAIYNRGVVYVNNSTFYNNHAPGDCMGQGGGAIFNFTGHSTLPVAWLYVTNSTFTGNSGGWGGSILNMSNYQTTARTVIRHSTFANNASNCPNGGASLYTWRGQVDVSNTIMADTISAVPECSIANYGVVANQGYNLVEDGSCGLSSPGIDPQLGPLQDNGGPTWTHALPFSSPAVDQIPAGVNGCGTTYTTDQRGYPRPQNGSCDIGSVEGEPPEVASFTSDGYSDGWVLERAEDYDTGYQTDNKTHLLRVGDDRADRQYKAIVSFDTASLPDTADLFGGELRIKAYGLRGDPFSLGELCMQAAGGYFNTSWRLERQDFEAAAAGGSACATLSDGWYVFQVAAGDIDPSGWSQFRLYFNGMDDNDNRSDDYLMLYGGYASGYAPVLEVQYLP